MAITPETCRAARSLLGLKQSELAAKAGVSVQTVKGFELGRTTPIPVTLAALQKALEDTGVTFIDADNGGAGVRLRGKEGSSDV
jgi:transcriptional regulator with XRE-family HTH domain